MCGNNSGGGDKFRQIRAFTNTTSLRYEPYRDKPRSLPVDGHVDPRIMVLTGFCDIKEKQAIGLVNLSEYRYVLCALS